MFATLQPARHAIAIPSPLETSGFEVYKYTLLAPPVAKATNLAAWKDAQVGTATVNGQELITSNAGAANSKGVEISSRAMIADNWTAYATYAYAKAELTEDAPGVIRHIR